MLRNRFLPLLGLTLIVMASCGGKKQSEKMSAMSASQGTSTDVVFGIVEETMDSGGYTYVRVNNGTEDIWAAGPLSALKVGDRISFPLEMPMDNFTSESLEKTFTKIYFVNSFSKTGADASKTIMMPANMLTEQAHGKPKPMDYEVEQMPGLEDGITIAELYRDKNKYGQQTIRLSGRVVKFTPQVMNRNWIHIQDGTDFDGSFDLTITSDAKVNINDIVVVEGTVTLDKDFGFGYKYDVLVENASVERK